MLKRYSLPIVIALIALLSCTGGAFYEKNYEPIAVKWDKDVPYIFEVENSDTLSHHDIYFQLRHNSDYPWSNIFIIVEQGTPTGTITKDTLEYRIIAPDGKALGTGVSDVKENLLLYKKGVQLKETGAYTFTLRHGMRNIELGGVCSVGILIK